MLPLPPRGLWPSRGPFREERGPAGATLGIPTKAGGMCLGGPSAIIGGWSLGLA